ncbi:hypothetical protein F2Q68_00031154 [Brassica cretica]|uniref:Aspartic peptidase DDI1-type domain-containing protein n=1 Tax=Brassica cretica TaxID=69181 RepID=A0A8S9G4J6_BRACR|nr:hypothetical protein F2Q68_00031154 [Brassica cretica]
MSFSGSHWCRPMSMDAHRSTDQDEDRSTNYSRNRSTSSAGSTAECSAVQITTHEKFAEKHPHPPPHSTPPPKPLANPTEPTINPSDTTPEPMQVDEATEGRVLRKRKEKIPKHLKRESNEKEMDGFTKRVLRIPVEKQFDEVYYTHRLWMFFRETKETEEDIRRMFHYIRETMKLRITLKKKSDPGKPPPKPLANPPEPTTNPSDTTPEPMQVDEATEGRVLRKRKEKIPKHLKRESNEKEMDGFTKRVLRIPVEKQFDEVYYTHRLWMFFRKTRETEEDIRRMFHYIRETMKLRITLKKKSAPGKFAIPYMVKGIEFPHALCDTGASVSILPKVMADQLGLKIEPSSKSFTFVDLSERSSGGIIRDLEVQIGNALVPVDFHVMDIKLNWNSSFLLGRAFLAIVGAVCDMNTNRLCLTLIDPDVHYDLVRVVRQQVNVVELGNNLGYIAACHCGAEYETEYSESIDTHTITSIDSNVSSSMNAIPRRSTGCSRWVDSGFHESFAVETVILSSNEDPTEEYDEDYWKERATEIAMQDERYSTHYFNNTPPPSIDNVYSASVDTHPHPAN